MATSPLFLPDLPILSRRPLLYRDAARASSLGLPPYVRAASSAALIEGELFVVQDDVHALARISLEDGLAVPIPLPLPGALARLKHDKADLEACALLPEGRLLVLGSGAKPQRRVAIELDPKQHRARVLPAEPLYEELTRVVAQLGGALNLEGVAVSGEVTHLCHRGPGLGSEPANVVIHLPTAHFLAALRQGKAPPSMQARVLELGALEGVTLTWTDAVEVYGVGLVFTASAEQTKDAIEDGPCLGSALGVLAPDGRIALARLVENGAPLRAKVEGLALAGKKAWLVTDPDDTSVAAELIEVDFGGLDRS